MTGKLQTIAQQAMALDPAERLQLAAELIDSVEGPADPGWSASWTEELRRRSAEADAREGRGEPRGTEWSEARARLLDTHSKR
jgi:hypothetical protein